MTIRRKIPIINKNNLLNKGIDFFTRKEKITSEIIMENVNWLFENKLLNNSFRIEYSDAPPSYSVSDRGNVLTIPTDYNRTFKNAFKETENFLKEKSFDFYFFHEVGHGFHHSNLLNEQNFISNPVNFKNELDNLCNNPTKDLIFNSFLKSTYRESYADCYAAISLYKKYGDINVFDNISNMRKEDLENH